MLGGFIYTQEDSEGYVPPSFLRAMCMRLGRIRSTLKRLEQLGYVEPGWKVDRGAVVAAVTEPGGRIARAVMGTLGLGARPHQA